MDTLSHKRQRPDSDDEIDASTLFRTEETFPKFLIIESKNKEKPITSLSPFVIDNLMKMNKFFNLPVEVTEHKTLNSSKGIIRDRILKDESEENIKEYLENQGVTNV